MLKWYWIALCCVIFFSRANAQDEMIDVRGLLRQVGKARQDTNRVKLLLQLSSFYIQDPDKSPLFMDSALLMATQAAVLSHRLKYGSGEASAIYWVARNHLLTGKRALFHEVMQTANDTTRIKLMLDITALRFDDPDNRKLLDTAMTYAQSALALSEALHSIPWKTASLLQVAGCTMEKGHLKQGKELFQQAFGISEKAHYLQGEVNTVSELARYYNGDHAVFAIMQRYRNQYVSELRQLKNERDIIAAQAMISDGNIESSLHLWDQNQVDLTMQEFTWGMEFSRTSIVPSTAPYYNLVYAYLYLGDLNKALALALESVRIAEKDGNKALNEFPYISLGKTYSDMHQFGLAKTYFNKAMTMTKQKGYVVKGVLLRMIAEADMGLHKPEDALPPLLDYINNVVTYERIDRMFVLESIGSCYNTMHEYGKAEKYLLEDAALAEKSPSVTDRYNAYEVLGKNYFEAGQYDKARHYLAQVLNDTATSLLILQREAHRWLFLTDTSTHDYISAIQHLTAYSILHDSVFNIAKHKQFEELKVQYETEKKDQDIQLLTKQGLLQTFNARQQKLEDEFEQEKKQRAIDQMAFLAERKDKDLSYKEENIKLLIKQARLQETALTQARWLRNGLIAGAVMLTIFLGMTYNRYRLKQRNNRLLEAQQQKINQSNIALQQLNGRQQELLSEKEWLIKEVHHRVKNNLQLVISLLNMQGHYLKDEFTLQAFSTISRRIQAISLIHQKLYQVQDVTKINMRDYILELMHYLKDSSGGTCCNIHYDIAVQPILLDPAMSVPLGLIINEAVTNAIKHAFTQQESGTITILMTQNAQQHVTLLIADNGKGMSSMKKSDGMGFTLMETLSKQTGATLQICNEQGTKISLSFDAERGSID